jgi:hypothetical protein
MSTVQRFRNSVLVGKEEKEKYSAKRLPQGQVYGAAVKDLPPMLKDIGLFPSIKREKEKKRRKQFSFLNAEWKKAGWGVLVSDSSSGAPA